MPEFMRHNRSEQDAGIACAVCVEPGNAIIEKIGLRSTTIRSKKGQAKHFAR
jgi:hypothetical protein